MGRRAGNDWEYWRDVWESVRGEMSLREFCRGNGLPYRQTHTAFKRLDKSGYIIKKSSNYEKERIVDLKEVSAKLADGEIDVIQAGLHLTKMGEPIPEVIQIMLKRTPPPEPEIDDDGVPDDILNADYEKAMADLEKQRKEWLPERREKIKAIKEELAGQGEFRESTPDDAA